MSTYFIGGHHTSGICFYLETVYHTRIIKTSQTLEEAIAYFDASQLEIQYLLILDTKISQDFERFQQSFVEIYHISQWMHFQILIMTQHSRVKEFVHQIGQDSVDCMLIKTNQIDMSDISEYLTSHLENHKINHRSFSPRKKMKNDLKLLEKQLKNEYQGTRRSIVVTGASGSGTSSVVTNAAVAFGQLRQKTLVVNLDVINDGMFLFESSSATCSNTEEKLAHVLKKKNSNLAHKLKVLQHNIKGVHWMTRSVHQTKEYHEASMMIEAVMSLKEDYDVILFDLPLEILHHAVRGMSFIDQSYLVINNHFSSIHRTSTQLNGLMTNDKKDFIERSSLILNKYNDFNQFEGKPFLPQISLELLATHLQLDLHQIRIAGVFELSKENEFYFHARSYSSYSDSFKKDLLRLLRNIKL
jgi:septum formation inhibitor-activating ATPase MinD